MFFRSSNSCCLTLNTAAQPLVAVELLILLKLLKLDQTEVLCSFCSWSFRFVLLVLHIAYLLLLRIANSKIVFLSFFALLIHTFLHLGINAYTSASICRSHNYCWFLFHIRIKTFEPFSAEISNIQRNQQNRNK